MSTGLFSVRSLILADILVDLGTCASCFFVIVWLFGRSLKRLLVSLETNHSKYPPQSEIL